MALVLRETKGSPLTFEEMDGNLTFLEGRGFPFTGDARIDGTLNIDFTDTLSFFSGEIDEELGPFEFNGPFIGLKAENEDSKILSGVYEDEDDIRLMSFISSSKGFIINTLYEESDAQESIQIAFFPDVDGELVAFDHSTQMNVVADAASSTWTKFNDAFEVVSLGYSSASTGLVLANDLSDDDASLLLIIDNNNDALFEVKNNGLFVGPNIPTDDPSVSGQIWSDNGVLTISAGAP